MSETQKTFEASFKEGTKGEKPPWADTDDKIGHDEGTRMMMPRVRGLAAVQDAVKFHPTAHDVIAQRGPSHGDFDDNAALSQQLKDTIRSFQRKDGSYPWHELTPAMKEALDMDCLKTSRAVTGRADFRDHWADKAGYATLVADRCPD